MPNGKRLKFKISNSFFYIILSSRSSNLRCILLYAKKFWPILLHKMGHYFLDTQYNSMFMLFMPSCTFFYSVSQYKQDFWDIQNEFKANPTIRRISEFSFLSGSRSAIFPEIILQNYYYLLLLPLTNCPQYEVICKGQAEKQKKYNYKIKIYIMTVRNK